MQPIKAIETSYKGYRFRSRLEARWAVFFENLGIGYQYEPEGFEIESAGYWDPVTDTETKHKTMYLPDFFLSDSKTWVEVKGSDELLRKDVSRLQHILDFESPMPGVTDSGGTNHGLLLLGDIPWVNNEFGIVLHPIIQHSKGLMRSWGFFTGGGFKISPHCGRSNQRETSVWHDLLGLPEMEFCLESDDRHWTVDHRFIKTPRAWSKVLDAYAAARSARFEHGEAR